MAKFTKPAGTNDFLPDQMVQRNFVENVVRETFEAYGYAQVQTPLFESFALLSAQSGEELRQKMFTFVGSDRVDYALRPELTAPVCRLVANGELQEQPYPYKLYYVGQCVRLEAASAHREFRQAGVELIGAASALADAEIITLPVRILEKLNIDNTKLKIGAPGIYRQILKPVGLHPRDLGEIILDLDALARRISPHTPGEYIEQWNRYHQVPEEIAHRCIKVSQIHGDKDAVMTAWNTHLKDIACEAKQGLISLCDALHNHDITDFEIDLGLTRGFDFYTGNVFQIELEEPQLPLCGGGRYDTLIESVGGLPLPGAGFAFQFDSLVTAFAQTENATISAKRDYFIATTAPELTAEAQRLAEKLRRAGKIAEVDLMERDAQAQHDYALQANYAYVLNLVPEQPLRRIDLKTGKADAVAVEEL
ncbi:hypothetical protein C6495_06055 [Candidatus Poribacteria bacterium]|nr:MAG: hypothetical protein C6495_06055 [Candidatus Poribacteria bacterium]